MNANLKLLLKSPPVGPVGKETSESDSLMLEPGDVKDVKTFSPDDGEIEIWDRF